MKHVAHGRLHIDSNYDDSDDDDGSRLSVLVSPNLALPEHKTSTLS